jgi:hypothetical protein
MYGSRQAETRGCPCDKDRLPVEGACRRQSLRPYLVTKAPGEKENHVVKKSVDRSDNWRMKDRYPQMADLLVIVIRSAIGILAEAVSPCIYSQTNSNTS